MVFEDLQWADTGLMDFIESVLEWSRTKPILVITLARPELIDRRPNWGAGQRSFVALHLEPLANEAMADLVRGLLPGASEDVVGTIVARADGVPMYAVETIRMLADRGVLQIAEGVYEVVGELGEIQIPETLHALVASRLDALGPEDRSLLQDAAVLGKTFTLSALAAVSGADAATLEPRLLELSRKEFLTHEADPRSPERGQFGFVQSIIREVAYGMLSKADRRSRHLTAAHHFEAAGEDELAGMVAAHYVEALAATPAGPDADALAARARDALGQAAERATALGAPVQALAFAEQALAITPSGPERAGLLEQAARAAGDGLRPDEQVMHLREAVDVWRAAGDVNAEAAAMGVLAVALGDRNKVDEVRSLVDQMRARLGDVTDELARSELDLATAYVQYFDEDLEGCLASIEHSLGGFERSRAWDRFRHAVGLRSGALSLVGRRRESRLLRRGILAVATDENDLRAMAGALLGLGTVADESIESLELSMEAAAVARRGGYGQLEMTALANAVEGAVECGAWETADGILADLRGRSDLPVDIADMIAFVDALLAAYRGDVHGAEVALGNLSEETAASPDRTTRSFLRRVRSVLALMAGDLDGAYREAMGAIEEAPEDINVPLAVWCAGRAALWLGDSAKARAAVAAGAGRRVELARLGVSFVRGRYRSVGGAHAGRGRRLRGGIRRPPGEGRPLRARDHGGGRGRRPAIRDGAARCVRGGAVLPRGARRSAAAGPAGRERSSGDERILTTGVRLTDIRKIVTIVEDVRMEAGQPVDPPVRRVVTAAVLANPFAGRYVEDLSPLIADSVELSATLSTIAVAHLDGKPVHSYGKGGIVGTKGELEHVAAMLHPEFGAPLREATGGGKAIIPSAKKRGGPGVTLDVPLHFKDAAFVRSHFDAVELRIVDAPADDEMVIAVAVTDGGRPLPRVGGLQVSEIVGEDGLR